MKKTVAITLFFFIYVATFCQVGIGTTTPDPSAALDVSSNAKGLLIPQMTQVQRRAIDKPATGLLVLQTDGPTGFYYNAGTPTEPNWLNLSAYTLQQNINTNGKWISHSGKDSGLFVAQEGLGIGTSSPVGTLGIRSNAPGDLLSFAPNTGGTRWHITMTDGTDLNFAETGQADGRLFLEMGGNVGIGTTDPEVKLDVAGDIKYSGVLYAGHTYRYRDIAVSNNAYHSLTIGCPTGMRATGGGGGHRDYNDASQDIVVNYSGPDLDNPETHWRVIVGNKDLFAFRDVRIFVLCAKIQ